MLSQGGIPKLCNVFKLAHVLQIFSSQDKLHEPLTFLAEMHGDSLFFAFSILSTF
ncbi:hypothetical protein ME1_00483 [Bartonella vinsonii subsp. arupensis OK-94-513]|uniref:Uncharacterized protein n=1 Tax=Bartonella vinsonii subsp. arupensis OK-94-513 TaxID=1094562 RepID=J0ZMJ4_BARVI|nr:hypothetical protein ME1_00483 [Bartonella vinsonii subsp. arupensis OK-94-513]